MKISCLFVISVCNAGLLYAQIVRGSIQGQVVGEDGRPVPAAISYDAVRPSIQQSVGDQTAFPTSRPNDVVRGWVRTAVDGTFEIPASVQGRFSLCAWPTGKDYLGSCEWGSITTIDTTAAAAAAGSYCG